MTTPPQRLRTHRVRVSKIDLKPMSAMGDHVELGRMTALVEDVSVYGMALRVPGGGALAGGVFPGDRLVRLTILCDGESMPIGDAAVRHAATRDSDLLLGVELQSSGIDLGDFYRRGVRRTFGERWASRSEHTDNGHCPTAFRAWLLELRDYLEELRQFLDAESAALEPEDELTRQEMLGEYMEAVAPSFFTRMRRACAELGAITRDFGEEQHRACRALCRRTLEPLIAHSPFMRRALKKPLGYAGDYELMNMLYREHSEGASLFGKLMNLYGTQETAGCAVVSRVEYVLSQVRTAARAAPNRARIASIGCGPAREIQLLLQRYPEQGCKIDVALIDQEERSIRYCERILGPLAARSGARIGFIRESVRRLLAERSLASALGTRHLIYSAGLFDYLNDEVFTTLLAALYEVLLPDGQLLIGNMAAHNPSRVPMEYFVEWFLIHRTPDQLRDLASTLRPAPSSIDVETETHGVNLFLVIRR